MTHKVPECISGLDESHIASTSVVRWGQTRRGGNYRQQEGQIMTFEEVLDQAMAMLQRRGRLTYRTLQLHFHLDDAHLEALKDEIIYGQRLAVDEDGRVLIWTGGPVTAPSAAAPPAPPPQQGPLAYTPSYLAEKILYSRSALE